MAAAVADYRPAAPVDAKLKKDAAARMEIALERTDDILSALAPRRSSGQTVVGFAAEHGDGAVAYGRDKLARKGLDAVVVNDIGRSDIGFDTPDNEVTIVTGEGETAVPKAGKAQVAAAVLDAVDGLRAAAAARAGAGR
jgi:phosphopantothenoylcysteine decarboxylase/phosphopantothenate--cysteine ligase